MANGFYRKSERQRLGETENARARHRPDVGILSIISPSPLPPRAIPERRTGKEKLNPIMGVSDFRPAAKGKRKRQPRGMHPNFLCRSERCSRFLGFASTSIS
ncbi:hypothetical protein ZHAS_00001737 [Anopheles sinensis]|uniref:Uncharacterized protein n=1 Tax=Anopheles sinensis TaxID=74873 RepID=A0A084VBJ7_ANOSI|nr:hypothetical protein ZHAS_00001737 [Anopheles sinensis]